MLEHGGGLRAAAAQYKIPLSEWLDLSTGINPHPYIPPALPPSAWQRLPEDNDGLEAAAALYYGNALLLPVAGSQVAIQTLPQLFAPQTVAVLAPLYNEHPAAWAAHGHTVQPVSSLHEACSHATIVLLCNPNNPTGTLYTPEELRSTAILLARRGGWLIVDEAFMDASPEYSLAAEAGHTLSNLIVLRSLGKFFGLAGARVGFALAEKNLITALHEKTGPWNVSHPARLVATAALSDTHWQIAAKVQLHAATERLAHLLAEHGQLHGCALFQYLHTPAADALHIWLAQRGILTRRFADQQALRFGLPSTENEWQRLHGALTEWKSQ